MPHQKSEKEQQALGLYGQGMDVVKIARQLKISRARVYQFLQRNGLVTRENLLTKAGDKPLKEYRLGESVESLAFRYKVGVTAVRFYLESKGERPAKVYVSPEVKIKLNEKIVQMYRDGRSVYQISAETGKSVRFIYDALKKSESVTVRPRGRPSDPDLDRKIAELHDLGKCIPEIAHELDRPYHSIYYRLLRLRPKTKAVKA